MPCIIVNINTALKKSQKDKFCLELSQIASKLLGKPEQYVMIILHDDLSMSMSGSHEPTAYIELKSLDLPEKNTSDYSSELCKTMADKLGIAEDRIYIEFTNGQRHLWGWKGSVF